MYRKSSAIPKEPCEMFSGTAKKSPSAIAFIQTYSRKNSKPKNVPTTDLPLDACRRPSASVEPLRSTEMLGKSTTCHGSSVFSLLRVFWLP
jgi:hypothetical protein